MSYHASVNKYICIHIYVYIFMYMYNIYILIVYEHFCWFQLYIWHTAADSPRLRMRIHLRMYTDMWSIYIYIIYIHLIYTCINVYQKIHMSYILFMWTFLVFSAASLTYSSRSSSPTHDFPRTYVYIYVQIYIYIYTYIHIYVYPGWSILVFSASTYIRITYIRICMMHTCIHGGS